MLKAETLIEQGRQQREGAFTYAEQDQSPEAIAHRELVNRILDAAGAYTEPVAGLTVNAINFETDELLIETADAHAIVAIREYLWADQVTIVPDTHKENARYAKFEWKGAFLVIPLGSNVADDPLPLRAGGDATTH